MNATPSFIDIYNSAAVFSLLAAIAIMLALILLKFKNDLKQKSKTRRK